MKVQACNLWFEQAEYRCVITSGARESDGSATMDHPSAIEAKKRYQGLEVDLGRLISARGNHVHLIRPGIIAFPTKQYAWSKPDRAIIRRSATELAALVGDGKTLLPAPVGPTDTPSWEDVSEDLASLPDTVIIIP